MWLKNQMEGTNLINKLKNKFNSVFGMMADDVYFAPGRVNLIGEHTDYNGGHVFPCALILGTYGVVKQRDDRKIRLYSTNFEDLGIISFSLDHLEKVNEEDWVNYPKGVLSILKDEGYEVKKGFDILYEGNIPNGAGLSSSASIEVLTGIIINELEDLNISMIDLVKISKRAENEYVGVNSGIMDQFAVAMGKKDKAMLLDTNTLKYIYANIKLTDAKIVISNTNKQRKLQDSKYNERRAECEQALRNLNQELNLNHLCDLTVEKFDKYKHLIIDNVVQRRAKHAVTENVRTLKAVKALKENNIKEFGRLMDESHDSLRDDYGVTGIELDTLVELARAEDGVIGSRMTGAGFGGCTVSIVENDHVEHFIKHVSERYEAKIGYAADFYVVEIGEGAHKIEKKIEQK